MVWFLTALFGYMFLASGNVLDKFILTKSVPKPEVLTFYSTIVMVGVLCLYPFGGELLVGIDWIWGMLSGVLFGGGLYYLFLASKIGEQSHITPFNGAVVSIATYWFSSVFLAESLSSVQVLGIGVLIFASFLLSFEKSQKHNGFHMGFVWAIVSGLLFAGSHVIAKYIYTLYPFLTGLIWTKVGIAVVGLCMLFFPSVRRALKKKKRKTDVDLKVEKKYALPLVFSSKVFAVVGVLLTQYAISVGSVSLVTALAGIQYVFLFLFIFVLTKTIPKVFSEYFTKRELLIESFGILLIVIGSALFVV